MFVQSLSYGCLPRQINPSVFVAEHGIVSWNIRLVSWGQFPHLCALPTSYPTPANFLGEAREIKMALTLWVHGCEIAKRQVGYQP